MSEIAYECPECIEDCEYTLPAVQSEYCEGSVALEKSEIRRILLAEIDPMDKKLPLNGPTDWTSLDAWELAIDNAGTGTVKSLFGIGDIPEPEESVATVHDGLEVVVDSLRTLNFSVLDLNQTNYDAARALQCPGRYRLWYESRGGKIYGGQNGISIRLRRITSPHERGNDAYKALNFTIQWNAKCEPERADSPFVEVAGEEAPPVQ